MSLSRFSLLPLLAVLLLCLSVPLVSAGTCGYDCGDYDCGSGYDCSCRYDYYGGSQDTCNTTHCPPRPSLSASSHLR